jgi:hypothetical protein
MLRKEPKFKWQDSLTLVGFALTIVAFASEDTLIVIGSFAVSALLICFSVYSHKEWKAWRYAISLSVIALFSALSLRAYTKSVERELSLLHGTLAPANDPDPPNSCNLVNDELGLYFGNMQVKASRFPLTVIKIADKPAVVMDRNADHSLSLSLDVRSADGRIIAKLERNVLTVNQNNFLSMERKDRSTLSVTDQNGMEVLHARYLNRHAFKLSAHLISEGRTVDLSTIPISGMCLKIEHGPEGAGAIGIR